MNCKKDDLAIFVKSAAGNEGKIVRCVRLASQADLNSVRFIDTEGPVWVIDRLLLDNRGRHVALAKDESLRPIRDPGDDAVDEMVQKLGKPEEVKV